MTMKKRANDRWRAGCAACRPEVTAARRVDRRRGATMHVAEREPATYGLFVDDMVKTRCVSCGSVAWRTGVPFRSVP